MSIANKLLNLANQLDDMKLYNEADTVTKIANSLDFVKTSNLISPDAVLNKAKGLNSVLKDTSSAINSTEQTRKNPITSESDDDEDKREAGFVNTSELPYEANRLNNDIKTTTKFLNNTARERSKSVSSTDKPQKTAKMYNLMGVYNDAKEQNSIINNTKQTIQKMTEERGKALSSNDKDKTGERSEEEEDKKAINLTEVKEDAKRIDSTLQNTKNYIQNTEQIRNNQ